MKVLVTGASGLVGSRLCSLLKQKKHEVIPFSHRKPQEIPSKIEAVIHLAGDNVGSARWSEKKKNEILLSRVDFTKWIANRLSDQTELKTFISAGAVGYYGNRGEELLREESKPGDGFLSSICQQWEKAVVDSFPQCRKVILRTGLVLASNGGALQKMLLPFKLGLGSAIGDGKQWMSWIQIQDLINLYAFALEHEKLAGIYNAVTPNPVTNEQFSKALATALHRPFLPIKVPAVAMKLALGEMSSLVLDSQKVSADKILDEKFNFLFPSLDSALLETLERYG